MLVNTRTIPTNPWKANTRQNLRMNTINLHMITRNGYLSTLTLRIPLTTQSRIATLMEHLVANISWRHATHTTTTLPLRHNKWEYWHSRNNVLATTRMYSTRKKVSINTLSYRNIQKIARITNQRNWKRTVIANRDQPETPRSYTNIGSPVIKYRIRVSSLKTWRHGPSSSWLNTTKKEHR